LPHAEQVKAAHPLMLRAIAAAKKTNDRKAGTTAERHTLRTVDSED